MNMFDAINLSRKEDRVDYGASREVTQEEMIWKLL